MSQQRVIPLLRFCGRRSTLILLVFAVFTITACTSGSAIVTGTTRAPIAPEQVRLYSEPPPDFEVIGTISASSTADWTEQGTVNFAIAQLKKQAAKLGANGVLLTSQGDTPHTVETVQGRAIFVKGQ